MSDLLYFEVILLGSPSNPDELLRAETWNFSQQPGTCIVFDGLKSPNIKVLEDMV